MELIRGNLAIKNHKIAGRKLFLFEKEKSGDYLYLGEFEYQNHEINRGEDTDKQRRNIIVFQLKKTI
jgi:hypothetical protein